MTIRTSNPRPITRPSTPSMRGVTGQLADRYEQCGLTVRAERIRAAHRRIAELRASRLGPDIELAAAHRQAVESVVNGDLTPEQAALQLDASRRIAAPLAAEIANLAADRIALTLARGLWAEGDALIGELDDVVQQAVDIIAASSHHIANISNDTAALHAPPAVATAWINSVAALERITVAQSVATALRMGKFVPALCDADAVDWDFHRPDLIDPNAIGQHPVHLLAAHIAAGARPGCVTADQIVELGYLA